LSLHDDDDSKDEYLYKHESESKSESELHDNHLQSSSRYLVVKGAVGDGVTDDTAAIQKAINKASNNKKNAVVLLQKGTFLIKKTLTLKGGVTLRGQGYGSSPLAIQFDAGGTVIAYCGTSYAIRVNGHAAAIENLAVYDWKYPANSECERLKGAGGVIVSANKRLVESVTMRNVLIYYFMGGTALTLEATNAGGIGYASMENIRIRHAKVGIHLSADETSFVNSNAFHDGAISGGITDLGILATGPGACNDNQFHGMVIEPPSTSIAHVYVSGRKTNIILDRIRLEGTDMSSDKPLVIVEDDSYGNIMNGLLGHTFVQADLNRNPGITFASNKMVGITPTSSNLMWNAAFHGIDLDGQSIPGWSFIGSDFTLELPPTSEEPLLYPDHNIISLKKNGSAKLKLTPVGIPLSPIHSFCTFGIYAKANVPNSILAVMKSGSGNTLSSAHHTGSGQWEFIGMSSLFDKTTNHGALPYFLINEDVLVTAPTFSYGHGPAMPGTEFLSSSGARMSGVLTMNMVQFSPPGETDNNSWWVIPKEGNIFEISPFPAIEIFPCPTDTSYMYVDRINHSTANRFHVGSVITLLFPACGGCVACLAVRHSAYINLLGDVNFIPSHLASHTSLTLISSGPGTWTEISRNTNNMNE
jgi:hypothetical protein